MTRSIWIGVVFFIFAMMASVGFDRSDRGVELSGVSLGGSAALADRKRGGGPRIELPDPAEVLESLAESADDGDDDDDDEGPDDGGDDN
jgi:hypothetical protein